MSVDIPLRPDPDEARDLLLRELDDPIYDIAEPTWFDRLARAVGDFFAQLFSPEIPDGWGPTAAIVAAVVIAVLVVAALLIWGRPRATTRSKAASATLFGDDDTRSAAQLRADADAAASRSDWDAAVVLRFRAVARGLAERVIVESPPGATAQAFSREAARAFPPAAGRLADAAGAFDDVRYLRRPGTEAAYRKVSALDDELASTRPVLAEGLA